jgi:hypothetical protein
MCASIVLTLVGLVKLLHNVQIAFLIKFSSSTRVEYATRFVLLVIMNIIRHGLQQEQLQHKINKGTFMGTHPTHLQ